jgi:hypothetical protein
MWLTPPHILAAVGPFDLDPCASPEPRPWPSAATHYTEADDGLARPWQGFVWCNPPFGPDVGRWLRRLADHGAGIGLCAARTETRWFVEQVWRRADGLLFLHQRPTFHRPDGSRGASNSGVPICLVGYGTEACGRLTRAVCKLPGSLVLDWQVGCATEVGGEDG